jgi:hypothetical protein
MKEKIFSKFDVLRQFFGAVYLPDIPSRFFSNMLRYIKKFFQTKYVNGQETNLDLILKKSFEDIIFHLKIKRKKTVIYVTCVQSNNFFYTYERSK